VTARRFALLCLATLTLSCSEPPEKEHQQALDALTAARAAEADTYAPQELAEAQNSLTGYATAVEQRDYRLALSHAIDARDRAHGAARIAQSRKSEARAAAEAHLKELDATTAAMQRRLDVKGAGRLTTSAANRVRAALRAAPATRKQAEALLARGDYRGASALLTRQVQSLRQVLNDAAAKSGGGNR
jgi:hypothetical protein